MEIVFSHASAYQALNALRADPARLFGRPTPVPRDPADRMAPVPLERVPSSPLETRSPDAASTADAAKAYGVDLPAHILAGPGASRRSTALRVPHVASGRLVPGSLVRLGDGVGSCSPELLLALMARSLDRVSLIWLGCELCAAYAFRPGPRDARGHEASTLAPSWPLTSRTLLAGYLSRAKTAGLVGAAAALNVLKHVLDRAASPSELELALAMTLPRAMGGHAVPQPQLNWPVRTDRRPAAMRGAPPGAVPHFTCDECWPERKLAVEYDSDGFHGAPRKRAYDNDRRAALEDMGYRVVPISTKQLDSLSLSEAAFRRVAAHLGVRDRERELAYDWQARRWKLRRQLHRLATRGIEWPQHRLA